MPSRMRVTIAEVDFDVSTTIESSPTRLTRQAFAEQLRRIVPSQRDQWFDVWLGLPEMPDDEALPRGCVPYWPCPVEALLQALSLVRLHDRDLLVDLGSGLGRSIAFFGLMSEAKVLGVEIQRSLVAVSRKLLDQRGLQRVQVVHGNATELPGPCREGTVFFMYSPFGGEHMRSLLTELERLASVQRFRIICVDMADLRLPWLEQITESNNRVGVYRSR